MSDYDIARRRVKVLADRLEIRSAHLRAMLEDAMMDAIADARATFTNTMYERGRADERAAIELDKELAKEPEGEERPTFRLAERVLDYDERAGEESWAGEDIEPKTPCLSDSPVSAETEPSGHTGPCHPPEYECEGCECLRKWAEAIASQEGMGQS